MNDKRKNHKPEQPKAEEASQDDLTLWMATAREAAIEAGKAIMEVYASGNFEVEEKADASPLTRADKAAHHIISGFLRRTGLPVISEEGEPVPFAERKQWLYYWLVDPLDGTKEFLKRSGEFTVNIALMRGEVPVGGVVSAPCLHKLYHGAPQSGVCKEEGGEVSFLAPLPERNTLPSLLQKQSVTVLASLSHRTPETEAFIQQFQNKKVASLGSSLKFMLLAEGKADIYPRFGPTMEWDTAAAHALLRILNRGIYETDLQKELVYNKPNLLNPSFIAF